MTQQELMALVEILNRCPLTAAERLWLQALITRLQSQTQEKEQ